MDRRCKFKIREAGASILDKLKIYAHSLRLPLARLPLCDSRTHSGWQAGTGRTQTGTQAHWQPYGTSSTSTMTNLNSGSLTPAAGTQL